MKAILVERAEENFKKLSKQEMLHLLRTVNVIPAFIANRKAQVRDMLNGTGMCYECRVIERKLGLNINQKGGSK